MTLCNARLFLGDDHGDNTCTFSCQLEEGHEGLHHEKIEDEQMAPDPDYPEWVPPLSSGKVNITWEFDQRFTCPRHGIQNQSSCGICDQESWSWFNEHECPVCYGLGEAGDLGKGPIFCPRCAGTGYDPEKYPELFAEAQRTGETIMEYKNKTWSKA